MIRNKIKFYSVAIVFALSLLFSVPNLFAQQQQTPQTYLTIPKTDSTGQRSDRAFALFYVFDLRERETFVQFTYQDEFDTGLPLRAHIQIFDVNNNCNENNFFDVYTLNDTHLYNLRDIQTNDGNPSGIDLPDNSYGIVVISFTGINGEVPLQSGLGAFGSLRIIDNSGYEYRTNAQQLFFNFRISQFPEDPNPALTFNFNKESGLIFSDIIGVTANFIISQSQLDPGFFFEWDASNPLTAFSSFDIDIVDSNETIFSCRDITYSCVNQDHPLLEELLNLTSTSVASFEYGINNAIPHSKGGELLCPGNTISEGVVKLTPEVGIPSNGIETIPHFFGFVGLNNGNGRGSMDSFWLINFCQLLGSCSLN